MRWFYTFCFIVALLFTHSSRSKLAVGSSRSEIRVNSAARRIICAMAGRADTSPSSALYWLSSCLMRQASGLFPLK